MTDPTLTTALVTAITALSAAVGMLFRDLRRRHEECETERKAMQKQALMDAQMYLRALEKLRGVAPGPSSHRPPT
jgi:hypothetical protein